MGAMTTAGTPAAASASTVGSGSGVSHGTCGGPERDCQTRSYSCIPSSAATSRAVSATCRE